MGAAHNSENRCTDDGSQGAGMATPHRETQRCWPLSRWTDDVERVAGSRWKQAAVDFLAPYKRTMSYF
ncbi:jg13051 [Pararge aegeria aegeria]|uniref:Jg13051 protein n=1 Tax=Pararge aegeria aegeria TaxID=348720 RepID=A0A8S4SDT0_9NEOP|nr:jg13051 [Pararge aegeria aegeria]